MDYVSVAIRVKPCENKYGKSIEVLSKNPPVLVVPDRQLSFSFDNIFSEESKQGNIYHEMVQPLVQNVINGYNSTVFAYGQTGTGKTYTIGTDPTYFSGNDAGLITRALNDILRCDNHSMSVYISFVEIYNEKVYDLLGKNKIALQIKGFHVNGVKKLEVLTSLEGEMLLIEGGKNRHTGETKQNSKSSRSHAIFTIYCCVKNLGQERESKLNLVDLAGSESVKKTGNEGSQLHEGININKGLLCIGQVINALSNNQSHVPYRQSTITTILQDSLNRKNYVTLVACIGTNIEDLTETVQTLEFAQRAKRVRNKPELNSIVLEYAKSRTISGMRSTSQKITVSTGNKFTGRTPLNHNSFNINRRPVIQRFNSTTNLSAATDSFLPINSTPSFVSDIPVSLSPIVNKCMEALGEGIMERVKNIVTDIVTPMANRINSPRISRRSLQREVTDIVRSQMSLVGEFNTFRNEIDINREPSPCCITYYDAVAKENETSTANLSSNNLHRTSFIMSGNRTLFKKPFSPIKRIKLPKKSIAASSPKRTSASPPKHLRRSIRLEKLTSMAQKSPIIKMRRSTRISMRKAQSPKQPMWNDLIPHSKIKKKTTHKKGTNLSESNHTKNVLSILNEGEIKDIMTLNTIGAKTAGMICKFRQLKGPFRKIANLSDMPWRGDGYQRFICANFLAPSTP